MNLRQYFFGYLFVRLARTLAVLALLITGGGIWYLATDYNLQSMRVRYYRSGTLDLKLRELQEELAFAQQEVERVANTGNLPPIEFSPAPNDSVGFEKIQTELRMVDERRGALKEQVIADFKKKAEALRSRIQETIEEIQQARAAGAPSTPSQSATPAPISQSSTPTLQATQTRSVFENLSGLDVQSMRETLDHVSQFFDDLAAKAEKEENKKLISDTKRALARVSEWLPNEQADQSSTNFTTPLPATPSPAPGAAAPQAPPPDPLTTAMENELKIDNAIEAVQSQISRPWRLDSLFIDTTQVMENEAAQCRGSENAVHMLRLTFALKLAKLLIGGLVVAFLILVFADFIQSFFDTATNVAAIRKRVDIDSGQTPKDTGGVHLGHGRSGYR